MTTYEIIKENADYIWLKKDNDSFFYHLHRNWQFREDKFDELAKALSNVNSGNQELLNWIFTIHVEIRNCLMHHYVESDSYKIENFPEYGSDESNILIDKIDNSFYPFYKNLLPKKEN
jgi:hypothetical protein